MGNLLWKRKRQQECFFSGTAPRQREGRWVNSGATNASTHPLDRDCPCLEQPPPGHPLRPQTESSALFLFPNIAAREGRRRTEKCRPWCKDEITSQREHPRSPLKACPAVEALGMFCCCPCFCWCNALHRFKRTLTALAGRLGVTCASRSPCCIQKCPSVLTVSKPGVYYGRCLDQGI